MIDIEKLAYIIQKGELPAQKSQIKMVSEAFRQRYFELPTNALTRDSGVLLLLYPEQDEWVVPLIQRPSTEKGVHSGQVAFPGGKKDETDNNLIHTALREAEEEIGLDTSKIKIIGQLSPLYVFASNFMIYPTLAYTLEKPKLQANPEEVAEIFTASVSQLKNPQTIKNTLIETKNMRFETPYFDVKGKIIWGATAMVLSEFIDIV
ncbi:MAG: CoA pyrophosphatase [Thermonemataceae bacterium]|nr:CoA pyrophosphatase [Thermonemataceae bacterium]